MHDIKSIICNSIENKKQEAMKKYDDKIAEINNENNLINIYYTLSEIYHNTMEQGKLDIIVLEEILHNNFFKKAKIKNGVNWIIFSNDDFDIKFSKCSIKEITIIFKTGIEKPYCSHYLSDVKIRLAKLTKEYLEHKTIKNFKRLADYNWRNKNTNIISKILKYYRTYKYCNKDFLIKINEIQNQIDKEEIEVLEKNKVYYQRQNFAKEFIKNIMNMDLNKFKDEGWTVTLYGIEDNNGVPIYNEIS